MHGAAQATSLRTDQSVTSASQTSWVSALPTTSSTMRLASGDQSGCFCSPPGIMSRAKKAPVPSGWTRWTAWASERSGVLV